MAAEEQNRVTQLKDLTECSICTNVFTDPRMLPCIHTFCLECISQTVETTNKKPGDKMPCPLCRKEFIVSVEGISGLQKNFFMENLIQMTTNLQQSNTTCDICKMDKTTDTTNIPEAAMQCMECQHRYCDNCSKQHLTEQQTKAHQSVTVGSNADEDTGDNCSKQHLMEQLTKANQIVTTGSNAGEDTGPTFEGKHCTKHTEGPLDYYCATCEKIVCVSCCLESHMSHDCKVDEEFRYKIKKHAWKMSSYSDEMLSLRMNVEQRKANFLKGISEKEGAICKRSLELKNMIDQHTETLLEELLLAKQNHVNELDHTIEDIDRCYIRLTGFQAYCTRLGSKGSASGIWSCIDEVARRADELEKDHEKFISRSHEAIELFFKPTDLQAILWMSNNNIVGRIQNETETTTQFENNAILVGLNNNNNYFYDDTTITKDVVQINLRLPHKVSILNRIPTTMKGNAAAAVYCNTMYVTGIGADSDEIWKYYVTSGWMKCSSLFHSRCGHSVAFIDEVLYICGGYVNFVEAYNAVTNKCSTVGELFHSVQNSGNCVPFKTSLYIFGGLDEDNKELKYDQVYDTKLNTCTLLSNPMPCGFRLMRAALLETSVILVGRNTCFIFNFETETWQERKQFKTDVLHFGLVLENDRLFVIGGGKKERAKDGAFIWNCRDDIRFVPLQNILENKPTEWKIHAKLPKPTLVHSYAKLRWPV